MNYAPTLMIQGCTSDAGKSTVVAGLCRVLAQQGLRVAPFKPQNMALNSAVTEEGGEIGRAQALQAVAADIAPSVHMNPVLLKPNNDTGAQVIVQGQSIGNLDAQNYHQLKPKMKKAVLDSYQKLSQQYQAILVEGAGSPAEVNLREGDIANMGFAQAVDCPVILVADIDKGGVFAHIIGTLACLSESEQNRIKGFIINRFRGDLALLPHISNHTDLDPLLHHPQVDLQWVKHNTPILPADLIILPGSKNIHFDLNWLQQQGWQAALQKHLRYGGKVIGICGGLQMLGQAILDPYHIESEQEITPGLGVLDFSTTLQKTKILRQTQGHLNLFGQNTIVKGYEIHHGITTFPAEHIPAVHLDGGQTDGMISADQQIFTTYLHGLFDTPKALQALLDWAGLEKSEAFDLTQHREAQLNWLAQTLEKHCKIASIQAIMGV